MEIRVIGDRQAGKTEMLLGYAERLCRQGRKVVYITHDQKLAHNCLIRMDLEWADGFQVYRSHGNERVTHTSGGEVRFASAKSGLRGLGADTVILDDISIDRVPEVEPLLAGANEPRIVKASL